MFKKEKKETILLNNNSCPDIAALNKEGWVCFLIDAVCLLEARVIKVEGQKTENYKDLK